MPYPLFAILQSFEALWSSLPQLFNATLVLLIFIGVGYAAGWLVKRGFRRAGFPVTYQGFFLKLIRWAFGITGFLLALKVLGFEGIATSILAGGGVTAIILGFAFRDIGENILAGFFLAFSRPFNISDLIRSEGLEGRVKSVDLRHTHIRTADGCDIFIPSAQIFTKPLMNYTRDGLRRANFVIGIDYRDDTARAVALLLQTVKQNRDIIGEPPPRVRISGFMPGYVELDVSFWINTYEQESMLSSLKTAVMNACRRELIEADFTVSSEVSTAVTTPPLTVDLRNRPPES